MEKTHSKRAMGSLVASVLVLSGCGYSALSDKAMMKYRGGHVSNLLKDRVIYNFRDEKFNHLTLSGGGDKYFIYTPALSAESQVKAMSQDVSQLCNISGGVPDISPYRSSFAIDESKLNTAKASMIIHGYYEDIRSFSQSLRDFEKAGRTLDYQRKIMKEYIEKGYFYSEYVCVINSARAWSVSIIPTKVDTDDSGTDQVWVLGVINY